jgi:shikimate kinase
MPGVGKSYWAEQITAHYGLQCIDLDNIIEVRSGMRIGTFFERFGEAEFRKLERLTLNQVLEVFNTNCVIACGGGTPCFYDNLAKMKAKGKVIYLKASLDTLFQNLDNESHTRPLLKLPDWKEKLAEMLENRKIIFEQADVIIPVESLSVKDFKSLIGSAV